MISDHNSRENLYLRVRMAFIGQGTSLHAWCRENDVAMPNARAAIIGTWQGAKAVSLVYRIMQAAGLR